MTDSKPKTNFSEPDLNERLKLLGQPWDEVSTEPTLFRLSHEERTELERRYTNHRVSPETALSWDELRADIQGTDLTHVPAPAENTPKATP